MRKSTRILLLLAIVQLGLAGLWWWLLAGLKSGDLQAAGDPAETVATVSSTIGGIMGALVAIFLLVWWATRRKEG